MLSREHQAPPSAASAPDTSGKGTSGKGTPGKGTPGEVLAIPHGFADDAALVAAAVAGHPAAARAVWDRFAALVRGLLRRTLGRDDVDDCLQETFLRFFRLVSRLREVDKLRSFIVGIALRVAREELRRRRVRAWLSLTPWGAVPEIAGGETDADANEALRRLERILDRVDADARIAFVLRFVENVPTTEIADVLSCSLATAKRRIRRARDRVEKAARQDPVLCNFIPQESIPGDNDE